MAGNLGRVRIEYQGLLDFLKHETAFRKRKAVYLEARVRRIMQELSVEFSDYQPSAAIKEMYGILDIQHHGVSSRFAQCFRGYFYGDVGAQKKKRSATSSRATLVWNHSIESELRKQKKEESLRKRGWKQDRIDVVIKKANEKYVAEELEAIEDAKEAEIERQKIADEQKEKAALTAKFEAAEAERVKLKAKLDGIEADAKKKREDKLAKAKLDAAATIQEMEKLEAMYILKLAEADSKVKQESAESAAAKLEKAEFEAKLNTAKLKKAEAATKLAEAVAEENDKDSWKP